MLPGSLSDALDVMEQSELVAEALGEHVFEWFIRNKRAEWREYKTQITQFELDRYYRNLLMEPAPLCSPIRRRRSWPSRSTSAATRGRPSADERAAQTRRARRRLGRRHRVRRRRPRGRVRRVPRPAQARPAARAAAAARARARSCTTSSCATTCSTTSASRRSTRASSRPGSSTSSGAPGGAPRPELIEYGDLVLNLETYQAACAGRPLDLTYMEYELLKFLAVAPRQGVHPRDVAVAGVGLRVLRRCPHGRRPHPAAARQARRGARQPHPDGALRRLPLRPDPLGRLTHAIDRRRTSGELVPDPSSTVSELDEVHVLRLEAAVGLLGGELDLLALLERLEARCPGCSCSGRTARRRPRPKR